MKETVKQMKSQILGSTKLEILAKRKRAMNPFPIKWLFIHSTPTY